MYLQYRHIDRVVHVYIHVHIHVHVAVTHTHMYLSPSLPRSLPLQVSELSDSPDHEEEGAHIQEVSYGSYATGGGDESHESFETSGGLSTSHTEQ